MRVPLQYRRLTELVSSAVALSLFLAACGSSSSSTSAPNSKAITGGTFVDQATFDAGSPVHIDPALATDAASGQVASMLFDGLTKTNSKGDIVSAVATSWKANADNTQWTFELRSDVKFSDGTPVTAQSFIDGWLRAQDVARSGPIGILGGFPVSPGEDMSPSSPVNVGVASNSPTEMVVHLVRSTPDFPAIVSLPQFAPTKPNLSESAPIVSEGEFVMSTAWAPGQPITLKRNDSYYGQKPYLDAVTFEIPKDNQSARAAVTAKTADDAVIPPTGFKSLTSSARGLAVISERTATEYWAFNNDNSAIGGADNFLLRRAIATAADKKDVDLEQFSNTYTPATGWASPTTPGYQIRLDSGDRNVEAAKDLLKEWGKTPPTIFLQFPSTLAQAVAEATTLQSNLKDIGLTAVLDPITNGVESETAIAPGHVKLRYGVWSAPVQSFDSALSLFISSSPDNSFLKYNDQAFDAQIANARKQTDTSEQTRYYQQAEATMLADQPVVPLEWPSTELVVTKQVQNLTVNPLGYIDYGNVWLKAS